MYQFFDTHCISFWASFIWWGFKSWNPIKSKWVIWEQKEIPFSYYYYRQIADPQTIITLILLWTLLSHTTKRVWTQILCSHDGQRSVQETPRGYIFWKLFGSHSYSFKTFIKGSHTYIMDYGKNIFKWLLRNTIYVLLFWKNGEPFIPIWNFSWSMP